jgi:hypothetical protein
MCVVALAGWNQLATNSYWRWRWGILIAGTAFLASIYLLPVLLVLLVAVVIDLCFIAPHRGLVTTYCCKQAWVLKNAFPRNS